MIALAQAPPATIVPAGLAAAFARDAEVAECANDAKSALRDWIGRAFEFRQVKLRSGAAMTVAIATDACLAVGQSVRVMIFERTSHGYRRVLDGVALPDFVSVTKNGTVILPTHETMDTIFEAAYVWNGNAYVYSAERSHLYDVTLGKRRPYLIPIRFAPGEAQATTLSGHIALNFGQTYSFAARAGQRLTLAVTQLEGRRLAIVLYEGENKLEGIDAGAWTGKLPHTAAYTLTVLPFGETDPTAVTTYSIRLSIR